MLTHELGVSPVGVSVKVHDIPSDYGRVNPVNHIPALELDDGTLFYDSRVICEYLDVSHGARLLPREGAARWRTLKLQVMGDGPMDAATRCVGELARPSERQWSHRLAEYERSMSQTLGAPDLGAISVACALGYLDFRLPKALWRASRPRLARWYESFAERPSMAAGAPTLPWSWKRLNPRFARRCLPDV